MQRALRRLLYAAAIFLTLTPASVFAQNPWNGKVILQGFWWDYYNDNYPNAWHNYVSDLAPRLRDMGIDGVWIPPGIKNAGPNSNGYSPFDHYDLGDKYQKANLKTRAGTKDEYLRLVAVLHANGIDVIQDVVLNHVDNAGSSVGAGGQDPAAYDDGRTSKYKNFRYVSYASPATDESSTDYLARSGRWSKNWPDFYPNQFNNNYNTGDWDAILFGPDISYESNAYGQSSNASYNPAQSSDYMRTGARNWMVWMKKQTGIDGVRLDAVKNFPYWVVQDVLYNAKYNASWANGGSEMFAVGEYVGGASELDAWINNVKFSNGGSEDLAGTFDFALRQSLKDMTASGGSYDLGSVPSKQQTNRYRTVPFVNNHDTFRPTKDASGNYTGWDSGNELGGGHIDPFDPRLAVAYAIAFAVDGSPQVFFEDLFNIGSTGKRYVHLPTSTTDLPVRDEIANIIWCHQKLNFKKGTYKVRAQAQDLLIIERGYKSGPENSYAIIAANDNWNTWQSANIQTDFGPNRQLHDYSGANGNDIWTDANSRATIWVPPCDGSNLRRGYSIWGPAGVSGGFAPSTRTTTQEWEMADDLGDSHLSSLQQGGKLPAGSTAPRTAGKIFAESGKGITLNLYPTNTSQSLTVSLHNTSGTSVQTVSGAGNLALAYTPSATGFYTVKVNNSSAANAAQSVFVKATYTAPRTASTSSYPARAASGGGKTEGGDSGDPLVAAAVAPEKTGLNNSYPNPFNPSTTVGFSLRQAAQVKVIVYNSIGQVVATLQDGALPAGIYSRTFNAASLPSGLYFVRMQTPETSQTQKVMLVK